MLCLHYVTQLIFVHSLEGDRNYTSLSEKPKEMKLEVLHAEKTTKKFLKFVLFVYAKSNMLNGHAL